MKKQTARSIIDLKEDSHFNKAYLTTLELADIVHSKIDKDFAKYNSDLAYLEYARKELDKREETRGQSIFKQELLDYMTGLYHSRRVNKKLKGSMKVIQFLEKYTSDIRYNKETSILTLTIHDIPVTISRCNIDITANHIHMERIDVLKDGTVFIQYTDSSITTDLNKAILPSAKKLQIVGTQHSIFISTGLILPHPRKLIALYTNYRKDRINHNLVTGRLVDLLNREISSYVRGIITNYGRTYDVLHIGLDTRKEPVEITPDSSNGLWSAIVKCLIDELPKYNKQGIIVGIDPWSYTNIVGCMVEVQDKLVEDGVINRNYRLTDTMETFMEYDNVRLSF